MRHLRARQMSSSLMSLEALDTRSYLWLVAYMDIRRNNLRSSAARGDADTNAVVCGTLFGCARGYVEIPKDFISEVPYASWPSAWAVKAVEPL